MEPASAGVSSLLWCARRLNSRRLHRSRGQRRNRCPLGHSCRPLARLRRRTLWPNGFLGRLGLRRLIRCDGRCGRRFHRHAGSWRRGRGRGRRRLNRLHDRRAFRLGCLGRPWFLRGRWGLSRLGRWRRHVDHLCWCRRRFCDLNRLRRTLGRALRRRRAFRLGCLGRPHFLRGWRCLNGLCRWRWRVDRFRRGRMGFWRLGRAGGRRWLVGRRRHRRRLIGCGGALRFWRLAWGDDHHLSGDDHAVASLPANDRCPGARDRLASHGCAADINRTTADDKRAALHT